MATQDVTQLSLAKRQDMAEARLLAALKTEKGKQVLEEEAIRYNGDTQKATASMVFYARQEVQKHHRKLLFEKFGQTKGGSLTVRELVHMSKMTGLPELTAPQALALLNKFDTDWTGGLNFDEFAKMLEHVQKNGADEFVAPIVRRHRKSVRESQKKRHMALYDMFKKYDISNSGSITAKDLVHASFDVHGPGAGLSLAEAEKVVAQNDVDGDGTMGFEEFKQYFKKKVNARKTRRQQRKDRRRNKGRSKFTHPSASVKAGEAKMRKSRSSIRKSAGGVVVDTEPTEEQLRMSFECIDDDGDGRITPDELMAMSGINGNPRLALEEAQEVVKRWDDEEHGTLSFEEFYDYWTSSKKDRKKKRRTLHMQRNSIEEVEEDEGDDDDDEELGEMGEEDKENLEYERILDAFDHFDTDGDGFVNSGELATSLSRIEGRPVSVEEAQFHINRFDADGNNTLDVEEFLQFMHSRRSLRKSNALEKFGELVESEDEDEELVSDGTTAKKPTPLAIKPLVKKPSKHTMPGVQLDWSVDALHLRAEKLRRDQFTLSQELEKLDDDDAAAEDGDDETAFPPAPESEGEEEEAEEHATVHATPPRHPPKAKAEADGETDSLLNARVKVLTKFSMGEIGTVKFCGETSFAPGTWVGVELDKACGKNDGTVKGVKYFPCKPKHGIFVRESMVELKNARPGNKRRNTTHAHARKAKGKRATTSPKTSKPKPRRYTSNPHIASGSKSKRFSSPAMLGSKAKPRRSLSSGGRSSSSGGLVSRSKRTSMSPSTGSRSPRTNRHSAGSNSKTKAKRSSGGKRRQVKP